MHRDIAAYMEPPGQRSCFYDIVHTEILYFRRGAAFEKELSALPAGVGLAVLREPVVRLLFMRGTFDEDDLAMTIFALLCFSFGLAGATRRIGNQLNPGIVPGG